ncbi:DUF4240 domain-containing protein [Bacillus sp. AFS041924]|uniref:DUF4240 domain-containing protein n=1 Tax=Bacillus sp. AFS041924 TaxID=2033503 RepID=UPI000BFDF5E4|nr:DUF4240 domain-containing protein [Bacillus sp. AFS041924]PGS48535.1 molybdenum metabolism regulator [Bacillus sp. AFS041924]
MNEKIFWGLISKMHIVEEPYEWVIRHLAKQSDDEIAGFEIQFETAFSNAYTVNLLGAAWIIMGGCSEDSFAQFRAWLIGQGEQVYKKTLINPDYLAEYIFPIYEEEGLAPELEEMLDLALQAFSIKRKGDDDWDDQLWNEFNTLIESKGYLYPEQQLSIDWTSSDELKDRFPKLWKRFGHKPLGQ